ncbi:MAG: hypothetical protein PUB10_02420 [Clostridiales bacterium]|nr:hypothetical protein [Clostridiales bacterium]
MNYKKLCFVFLLSFFLLTGCQSEGQQLETEGDSFDQSFYQTEYLQRMENGYYFPDPNKPGIMDFYDTETDMAMPLCNKPECTHNSDECNAYFPDSSFAASFQCADRYIYRIGRSAKDKGQYVLYRITPDGSSREELCNLYKAEGEDMFANFIVHKGSIYYVLRNISTLEERTEKVYRVPCRKNAKVEEAALVKGLGVDIYRMKAQGDNVYFQAITYEDKQGNGCRGNLYKYNIRTGKTETAVENLIKDFVIVDGIIYGDTGSSIVAYDTEKGTSQEVWPEGKMYLSYDGTYIYGDTQAFMAFDENPTKEREIIVWDKKFKEIDHISLPADDTCYFGGMDYLFAEQSGENGKVIKRFDKKQIGTGKQEWNMLEIEE